MIIVNNPLGQDPADFNDEDAADRIGHRIRKIREARNMSISLLAEQIGISADMMQKYENGQRKPKTDRLIEIANVLGVSSLALTDPALTSYIGTMYALFELEEKHGLELVQYDDNICIRFAENNYLNEYLHKWFDKKENINVRIETASNEAKEELLKEYYDWEWTFPAALSRKPSRKDKIKEKEALEKRLRKLNDDLNE